MKILSLEPHLQARTKRLDLKPLRPSAAEKTPLADVISLTKTPPRGSDLDAAEASSLLEKTSLEIRQKDRIFLSRLHAVSGDRAVDLLIGPEGRP